MKRVLFGLVLIVAMAATMPASAALTTITSPPGAVSAGWNLIALPGIPVDPDPANVLTGINIDGNLYRWDAAMQGLYQYDMWSPDQFGNMLLTDGYWLQSDNSATISYSGLDDNNSMDVWISLPKAGWSLIGNPFNADFSWPSAKVVDGNVTVDLQQAAYTNGWLNSIGFWWDGTTQGLYDIGIPDDFAWTETMQAWHGYWIQSNVDKIALIFESS